MAPRKSWRKHPAEKAALHNTLRHMDEEVADIKSSILIVRLSMSF
jgi:hypothetical protein